jgi:hydroxymethylglutaryl-CoA lyase
MALTTDHKAAYLSQTGSLPFALPPRVEINEVGPRDGFQLEKKTIATPDKVAIIDALARTGIRRMQITSFVRPDAVPQLTDADEVMESITRAPGVGYTVLVPNLRGAQRALRHGADCWDLMLSTTDAHSLANANRTTADTLTSLREVVDLAGEHSIDLAAGLGTALGCPFEGRVGYDRIAWVVGSLREMGVRRAVICDTVGVADPGWVYEVCSRLTREFPDMILALHLHDTRGLALANVLAGLAAGITNFDSSVGGLGGCPFAPGASGNVATEDLVHMLDLLGVETGVDLDAMIGIARELVAPVVDHPLESSLPRSGPSWQVYEAPGAQQLPRTPVPTA